MAQTVEGFVNNALDEAKISPLHQRVIALIAAGYFCDVIDYTVYGSLVPFIIKSGFGAADAALIGSATIAGLAIGARYWVVFGLGDGVGLGDFRLGSGPTVGEAGASSGIDIVPSSLTAGRRRRTGGGSGSVLDAGELE